VFKTLERATIVLVGILLAVPLGEVQELLENEVKGIVQTLGPGLLPGYGFLPNGIGLGFVFLTLDRVAFGIDNGNDLTGCLRHVPGVVPIAIPRQSLGASSACSAGHDVLLLPVNGRHVDRCIIGAIDRMSIDINSFRAVLFDFDGTLADS